MPDTTTSNEPLAIKDLPQEQKWGKAESLGHLFTVVERLIQNWGNIAEPGDDRYYARQELCNKARADFYAMLASYGAWSGATGWSVDFIDATGAFGILLTGQYTCCVILRPGGNVSGHS